MSDSPDADARTLAELMAAGKIPVLDALRYALLVSGALRKLHDEGRAHGALSCAAAVIRAGAAELIPAEGFWGPVTPYTAPELLAGQAPDSRSDVFSFGAVVYELLTGRRAFSGDTPAALAEALKQAEPAPTGSAILDRFTKNCVAKDPEARWRIGKVQLELKLMAVAVRRAASGGAGVPALAREYDDSALRAELRKLESRVNAVETAVAPPPAAAPDEAALEARIAARVTAQVTAQITSQIMAMAAAQERAVVPAVAREVDDTAWRAEMQRLESRVLARLESHERNVDAQLATRRDSFSGSVMSLDSTAERTLGRVERGLETVVERVARIENNARATAERVDRIEQTIESDRQDMTGLRKAVAEDIDSFEKTLASQVAAVETARTAIAQTDELVERVVEALEQLQSVVMERPAEPDAIVMN